MSDARRGAVALLGAVLTDRRMLSESLGILDRYEPSDRARAQRLATETLRALDRADRLLNRYLDRRPPPFVQNVLRLGTVELCTGGAAHGVVSDLVSLTRSHRKNGSFKGLVNAVLRKVASEGPEAWPTLRAPRLPKALRSRFVAAWGADAVAAMEQVQAERPPLDLTPRADGGAALAEAVGGTLLPTGSVRLADAGQVSALPGFAEGEWWVQDAAAAIPARLLDAKPGEKVLDMCAAPGGKTLQLAAAGADVTALDLSETRMKTVTENLARTGLSATLVIGDARAHKGLYDAILLDAPCSATGTIRRHPDLPHIKPVRELDALVPLQAEMLDHAWTLLGAGGRLVFCTCSLLPEEGETQILRALERLEGAAVDRDALARPGIEPAWHTPEGGLRLRPDVLAGSGGVDGFYMACLRKAG
ncbi:RsmB/NOP family class I SAM-dependent RNA methyltransferase [Marinibacterium profundimaris]|uniref:16S rRNA methyltransferase n=1 Tax=Marinibacterium profundimaris TaxID=1679460 RepID=A0A225NTF3_9RHOB|nr:transcription antitermination factor NusB [Marinibacterium profundimaris]OWU76078.1 16S rRNA methyltransferase [Marinibacterium profundimaris]